MIRLGKSCGAILRCKVIDEAIASGWRCKLVVRAICVIDVVLVPVVICRLDAWRVETMRESRLADIWISWETTIIDEGSGTRCRRRHDQKHIA